MLGSALVEIFGLLVLLLIRRQPSPRLDARLPGVGDKLANDGRAPTAVVVAWRFNCCPNAVDGADRCQRAGDRCEVLLVLGARFHDDAVCADPCRERRELAQQIAAYGPLRAFAD
ncbi:MAG TPA: hypothetical protein VIW24_20770 [Aldersonia sp.]